MIYLGHNFIRLDKLYAMHEYFEFKCIMCDIYAWVNKNNYVEDGINNIYYSTFSQKEFLSFSITDPRRVGSILNITCDELIIKKIIE